MCDAIREEDDNYQKSQELVKKDGCLHENNVLSDCLKIYDKDWRKCKVSYCFPDFCFHKLFKNINNARKMIEQAKI